jgi:DNA-binding CsgD family transcriptional regulator
MARHETVRDAKSKLNIVRTNITSLTPRERQVFELVVRGMTNKQVANTLASTERTIKAHHQRVMEKMRVRSLAELVSFAERVGILVATPDGRQTIQQSIHRFRIPTVLWDSNKQPRRTIIDGRSNRENLAIFRYRKRHARTRDLLDHLVLAGECSSALITVS